MKINTYDVGDRPKITGQFYREGELVDPDSVAATVRDPAGMVTTLEVGTGLERVSVGTYSFTIDITASGTWFYRLAGSGAHQAAAEGAFRVRPSRV
jgi:hypothetical protein